MVDTNDLVFITEEDFLKEIKERQSAIRDLLNDIDILINYYVSDRNLTSDECADFLKCSKEQLPLDLPYTPVGRRRLYKKSDIERWMKNHKKTKKNIELY